MKQKHQRSKIKAKGQSSVIGERVVQPNNLFLDETAPLVNVILVNQSKKNRINIDPNELLMEFHCEV